MNLRNPAVKIGCAFLTGLVLMALAKSVVNRQKQYVALATADQCLIASDKSLSLIPCRENLKATSSWRMVYDVIPVTKDWKCLGYRKNSAEVGLYNCTEDDIRDFVYDEGRLINRPDHSCLVVVSGSFKRTPCSEASNIWQIKPS